MDSKDSSPKTGSRVLPFRRSGLPKAPVELTELPAVAAAPGPSRRRAAWGRNGILRSHSSFSLPGPTTGMVRRWARPESSCGPGIRVTVTVTVT